MDGGPVGVRFDPKFRTDVGVEEFMDNFKKYLDREEANSWDGWSVDFTSKSGQPVKIVLPGE